MKVSKEPHISVKNESIDERRKILRELTNHLFEDVNGILLTGSSAYSPRGVGRSSDLDIVIIAPYTHFLSPCAVSICPRLDQFDTEVVIRYGIDHITIKIPYENRFPLGYHLITPDGFERICGLNLYEAEKTETKKRILKGSFSKSLVHRNFDGTQVEEDRRGFYFKGVRIVDDPYFLIREGKLYLGLSHDMFLCSCIVLDTNGYVENNLRKLWENVNRRMQKEAQSNPLAENLSVINSLSRNEKFDPEIKAQYGKDFGLGRCE